ncbi:alpha-L-fucosidase [Paraflavitalea pollutisoli]|uniref:alpha-L-fucosidase n=1 Tax=Paraflavitalea pollutisoli TaxID=3034143 RepID=UPI0023EDEDB3|nr:alpha-L-fucosidase [Paraflavitalea sp. H1-2-19X]
MQYNRMVLALLLGVGLCQAQAQDEMWDKTSSGKNHPNIQWFKDAKFGLFIHWGLYSQLGGVWNNKRYYGSGEWLMNQAKVPAADYAAKAAQFNPVNFNADEWAGLAKDAGIRYMVITAKHHEGFAMYDSKVSNFSIVKASPYRKDPMKALAEATRKRGIQFGFYYSQFLDWHEPDGGGNRWDFEESKKDYLRYYREKSIPQLKELMTNYGPLGIVWFDMPGGLTRQQTQQLVDTLRQLQPGSLFSSRVGQGLGDYRDFGDSEVPPAPIEEVWESIYTHNDSWGYIEHDMNFKSPAEIIRLLANVASKGGNLMLNVGPDGKGNIPSYSAKYLRETGRWLAANGESIYGTTYGFVPGQPWGVTTAKPGKLFLHVLDRPRDGKLLLPDCSVTATRAYALVGKKPLVIDRRGADLYVQFPAAEPASPNTVIVLEYTGKAPAYNTKAPVTISAQVNENIVEAVHATTADSAAVKSLTYSHYFGDWKHAVCVTDMQGANDSATFHLRITEPADYKIVLEYACPAESARQEGQLTIGGQSFLFRTLRSSEFDKSNPLLFIQHAVAITTIGKPGLYSITVKPRQQGKELFKLKSIRLLPVH